MFHFINASQQSYRPRTNVQNNVRSLVYLNINILFAIILKAKRANFKGLVDFSIATFVETKNPALYNSTKLKKSI